MDRIKKQQLGLATFFFAAYNVIFFLMVGDLKSQTGWISYAFVCAAFVVFLLAMCVGGSKNVFYADTDSPSFLGLVLFMLIFVLGLLFTYVTPKLMLCLLTLGILFCVLLMMIIRAFVSMRHDE